MNKKVLIIVVALLLAGGGGTAAFLLMGKDAEAEKPVATDEPPGLVSLDNFLVNLSDTGEDHFAKLNLRLTVSPASVAEAVQADDLLRARLRDRTLTLVSSKTYETLLSPMGKEALRRELKIGLEPLFEDGKIEDVLFTEFMVQ